MREIKFRAWDGKKMDSVHTLWLQYVEKDWYIPGDKKYEAIMQNTGLKDKNGKEIYEGDIVTDAVGDKREIIFEDGWFCCKYPDGSRYCPTESNRTVIGNIYENKELLSSN